MRGIVYGRLIQKRGVIVMTTPIPAFFFGHGNPMDALLSNEYTNGWAAIGAAIPRPTAVLAVSAHWYIPNTSLTAM
jgi:4,5-DOPA dioxygenase extradiol